MYQLVVYSMTEFMGTVTTGLSSSAWKKVHKEGYFVTRVKVVKIEYGCCARKLLEA
jgi:hypothetical protein